MDVEASVNPKIVKIRAFNYETAATSALLSDSAGAFGIKRLDTGASVVADATAMTEVGTGEWEYDFTPPASNTRYVAAIEITQTGGAVDRAEVSFYVRRLTDRNDPYLLTDDELIQPGVSWLRSYLDTQHQQVDFSTLRLEARRQLDRVIVNSASPREKETVRDYLNRGYLMVTDTVQQAQRAWIYQEFLDVQGRPESQNEMLAKKYRDRWRSLAGNLVAEFDVTGDGERDFVVNCSGFATGRA